MFCEGMLENEGGHQRDRKRKTSGREGGEGGSIG